MTDPPPTQAIDWEGRYRDGATGWERAGLNPSFTAWRESGALAPCRILVPAAGRSPEPVALAEAGFDVTLVDASPTAVATQRARLERLHVKAQVTRADLLLWNPAAPFDAIYDQTCLCALPPSHMAGLHRAAARLAQARRRAVHPVHAVTLGPAGPPFHCDLGQMRLLFPETNWIWPDTLPATVAHSPGISEQPAVLRPR